MKKNKIMNKIRLYLRIIGSLLLLLFIISNFIFKGNDKLSSFFIIGGTLCFSLIIIGEILHYLINKYYKS
ncbi:hypothetical protein CMU21_00560 [Elizabethkingia anophelis]|nr:hypothetical protein [Elizabethkingia anophelis]MDV3786771.1 hypothetical protein [Elizabethkingia anophelis]